MAFPFPSSWPPDQATCFSCTIISHETWSTRKAKIKISGTDVIDGSYVSQTVVINGMKSWIPIIVAISAGVVALIFLIISFILINRTGENKRYKLIRRSM